MRRLWSFAAAATLWACQSADGATVEIEADGLLQRAALAGVALDTLEIEVSGRGFTAFRVPIDPVSQSAQAEVAAGVSRRFELRAERRTTNGESFPVFVGSTVVNLQPGPQQLILPYREAGALILSGRTVSGAAVPSGVFATVTKSASGERTRVALGEIASLEPGRYTVQASFSRSGELFEASATVEIELGQLIELPLLFFTPRSKCQSQDPEIRAAPPTCLPITVTASQLQPRSSLELTLNGTDTVSLTGDGAATFPNLQIAEGQPYVIEVSQAPSAPRQRCTPSGIGIAGSTDVTIVCGAPFVRAFAVFYGELGDGPLLSIEPEMEGPAIGTTRIAQADEPLEIPIDLPATGGVQVRVSDARAADGRSIACTSLDGSLLMLDGSDPPPVRFVCLGEPVPLYGSTELGTFIRFDGSSPFDATGAPCDPAAADERKDCFDASMVREIVFPGALASSCDGLGPVSSFSLSDLRWSCESDGTNLRLRSAPPEAAPPLQDLLDFDGAWFSVGFNVAGPGFSVTTPFEPYFSNPTEPVPVSGELGDERTVYWFTTSINTPLTLTGAGASLVGLGGANLLVDGNAPALTVQTDFTTLTNLTLSSSTDVPAALIAIDGAAFTTGRTISISGQAGDFQPNGLNLSGARFSRFGQLTVNGTNTAISVVGGEDNAFNEVAVTGAHNALVTSSPATKLTRARVQSVSNRGVLGNGDLSDSVLRDIRIADSAAEALRINADVGTENVSVIGVRASNNQEPAQPLIRIAQLDASRIIGVQANNSAGTSLELDGLAHSLVKNVTAALPPSSGVPALQLNSISNCRLESVLSYGAPQNTAGTVSLEAALVSGSQFDLLGIYGGATGLDATALSNTTFDTALVLDDGIPLASQCVVSSPGALPGLIGGAGGCAPEAPSTAALSIGAGAEGFVALGGIVPAPFDWFTLPPFQDYAAIGSSGTGSCAGGSSCEVVELRGTASSGFVGAAPPGSAIGPVNSDWGPASSQAECDGRVPGSTFDGARCSSRYLPFALELPGDTDANQNGLCDVEDRCLYAPNIGAWQGEGVPSPSATVDFDGRTVELFTLPGGSR